ncbi:MULTISPECIES: hypothetical protein [Niastella]|uniref:Lipocalin-like domain-containing protein n=1 Tax=Niastella soli TaxID=2821487 RepID=A0ABS3YXR6_9BACT|nr:hypothetical protein [Niastella soli]MBO9202688.1 hypothetical protein [Niastella soli]
MKTTYSYLIVALMVTASIACKKDKDEKNSKEDLISTWELAQIQAGMIAGKTYEPGNGNLLTINADTYAYYKDGQVIEKGNYTTAADNSVEENVCLVNVKDRYKRSIVFTNVTPARTTNKTFYYIENDKLYLLSGCFALDGGVDAVYRRSNPIPVD